MDATRFDRMTKAAATGMSRRQVLRGLLAVTGGVLVHLTGGESDARRAGWTGGGEHAPHTNEFPGLSDACP